MVSKIFVLGLFFYHLPYFTRHTRHSLFILTALHPAGSLLNNMTVNAVHTQLITFKTLRTYCTGRSVDHRYITMIIQCSLWCVT